VNGETNVVLDGSKVLEVIRWLHDDPDQSYEYLSDVTAVEHRDAARPIEVVWHLRSLRFRRFLRLKIELAKGAKLEAPSVWGVYKGSDWLERECYDMFGIRFDGHPDLRRILLWEQYKEGFPLRKDFPLRGRFSRSEQLKQAPRRQPGSALLDGGAHDRRLRTRTSRSTCGSESVVAREPVSRTTTYDLRLTTNCGY